MNARFGPTRHALFYRRTEPELRRRTIFALGVAPFLGMLVFAAPPPLFPAMARDLNVGIPEMGQIMAAMLLFAAFFGAVAGPLADRHGHRGLLGIGAVAAAGSLVGFGLAPTYLVLLGVAVLGGLANAVLPNLSLALAGTAFGGVDRRRAVGWATAGGAGAAVVGVPLVTALGEIAGWRAAFVAVGLAALIASWFVGSSLPPGVPGPKRSPAPAGLLAAYRPLLAHGGIVRLYGTTASRAVCWSGLLTYLGAFLNQEMDLSAGWIGSAYLIGGTGYVGGSLVAGRLMAWVPARRLVAATNLTLGLTLGLTFAASFGGVGTLALILVAGIAGAIGWVGVAMILTEETPGGTGTTMSLNGVVQNLGSAGGGAFGGTLVAVGGFQALALGMPIFAVLAAVLVGRRGRSWADGSRTRAGAVRPA